MKSRVLFSIVLLSLAASMIYFLTPLSDKTVPKLQIDASVTASSLSDKCGGSSLAGGEEAATKSRYCYLNYFLTVLKVKGPLATTKQLETWAAQTGGLNGECHNVGHLLGQEAYKLYKLKALEGDATVCAFSFGHGILVLASKTLTKEEVVKNFSNLCIDTKDLNGCVHGYGHATADVGFDPIQSERICDKQIAIASANPKNKISEMQRHTLAVVCMEGWIMEQFFIDNKFWITNASPEKALEVCGEVTGAGGNGCRGGALRNWVIAPDYHQKDFLEVREERLNWMRDYCLKQADTYQIDCMGHLGLTAAEVWTLELPNAVAAPHFNETCVGKYKSRCIIALANSRWNRYGNSVEKVLPLCALLNKEIGVICRDSLYTF